MPKIIQSDPSVSSSESSDYSTIRPHSTVPGPAPRMPHFRELYRPDSAFHSLHALLQPHATVCPDSFRRSKWSRVRFDKPCIWVITSGDVSVLRASDNLTLGVFTGPSVIGLQSLFSAGPPPDIRVSRDALVSCIPAGQAMAVIDEQQAWKAVAEIQSFFLRMMAYRDEHLVGNTSYATIRAKLLEYMRAREILIRSRTGIVRYIQQTTNLSKSVIYAILAALCEGGYISMSKGKLDEIRHLPEKF